MILSPVLKQRFFDSNGSPLAGGKLYSYEAGTSTPLGTFSNSTGTVNVNPVILDANGEAAVWINPELSYKFILKDSDDVTQFTVDVVTQAVSTAMILDSNVTTAKIADDAVTTAKILNANVTTAKIADLNVTQAKLAARATGTTVAAGGIAVSTSTGSFSAAGTSVSSAAATVTITTLGRPVFIGLTSNAADSYIESATAADTTYSTFYIQRDGVAVGVFGLKTEVTGSTGTRITVPVSSINMVEVLAAGTYTYTLKLANSASGTTGAINNAKLIAYEL